MINAIKQEIGPVLSGLVISRMLKIFKSNSTMFGLDLDV